MKNLFNGMKRAKARTLLSLLVALVMTVSIGVCSYQLVMPLMHSNENSMNGMQIPQDGGNSDNTDSAKFGKSNNNMDEIQQDIDNGNNADTDSDTTDESGNDSQIQSKRPDINNSKAGGQAAKWIAADAAIIVLGTVLLIAINFVSTKKRENEFSQMLLRGIQLKAIKKQLFLEAFVIVLIAGLVGAAIGTAIAQPVSKAVLSQNISSRSDASNTSENFDFGNRPDRTFDEDANVNPENSNDDTVNDDTGDSAAANDLAGNDTAMKFNGDSGSNVTAYAVSASAAVVSALVFAIVSGLFCAVPVNKIKAKENGNEQLS